MMLIVVVLALVIMVRVLTPRPALRYQNAPYSSRSIEAIISERKTEALIQRCLATRGQYADSLRPTRIAYAPERDQHLLNWPNGNLEWVSGARIADERIQPK